MIKIVYLWNVEVMLFSLVFLSLGERWCIFKKDLSKTTRIYYFPTMHICNLSEIRGAPVHNYFLCSFYWWTYKRYIRHFQTVKHWSRPFLLFCDVGIAVQWHFTKLNAELIAGPIFFSLFVQLKNGQFRYCLICSEEMTENEVWFCLRVITQKICKAVGAFNAFLIWKNRHSEAVCNPF